MKIIFLSLTTTLSELHRSRASLHLEVLALRKQLAVPTAIGNDCEFGTSNAYSRSGFIASGPHQPGGRPAIDPEIRELVRAMSSDNIGGVHPSAGPKVHGELQMLGIQVSQSTVARYMIRHRKPSKPGEHFSKIMRRIWCRSTSSLCQQ